MTVNKTYYLYVLLCDAKILYTGIAINPDERLLQHQQGHPYGAKFTRRFKHLEMIYQIPVGSRSIAQSIEIKFKKLTATEKHHVIKQKFSLTQLIELLK